MAQLEQLLDREQFTCPICQDLLRDPVAIPCGHSYCMTCIDHHWRNGDPQKAVSCLQCRQSFTPKPILSMNTILADMVEKLKVMELPAAHSQTREVECDFCSPDSRDRAVKSCLVCLVSYCSAHLQPHYQSAALKKHKLVEASRHLQEKICPQHNRLLERFCQTDGQCVCLLCVIDGHKDHDTVSVATESTKQQVRNIG